ncbi:MAG: DUF4160 domain-containing protein [Chitinophagaceae bacterium]
MPSISRFLGIVIYFYYRDHNPPHFHAVYGEFEAEIVIEDLSVDVGYLPPRVLGLVMEWAALHKAELFGELGNRQKG